MHKILRCSACNRYTMQKTCPACGASAVPAKPQKYSPEDKYGAYRRKAKEEQ